MSVAFSATLSVLCLADFRVLRQASLTGTQSVEDLTEVTDALVRPDVGECDTNADCEECENDTRHTPLLGNIQPRTEEVIVNMTPLMSQTQRALLQLIENGLTEVKKTRSAELDSLDIKRCLFKAFDLQLQDMLDPIWSTLHPRTRKLVQDLSHVRRLLASLSALNCVHFYLRLEALRQSDVVCTAALLLYYCTATVLLLYRYCTTAVPLLYYCCT
eukprot:Lankesteria_metandrocarpae@DN928_c0_g1_i2.p2